MFMISCGYNIFKKRDLTIIGIFLSTMLTYSILYLLTKIKILGIRYDSDVKLIFSVLAGFVSIELFEKFNPVATTSYLINYFINVLLPKIDKDSRNRVNQILNERSDKNDGMDSKKDYSVLGEDKNDSRKDKPNNSFRETK